MVVVVVAVVTVDEGIARKLIDREPINELEWDAETCDARPTRRSV